MGSPIRKSADITDICSSPQLIAACHVLLRLLMPRHSPCALSSLTCSSQAPYRSPRRLRATSRSLRRASSPSRTRLRWASLGWGGCRNFYASTPTCPRDFGSLLELCRQLNGSFTKLLPSSFQMFPQFLLNLLSPCLSLFFSLFSFQGTISGLIPDLKVLSLRL